MGYVDQNLISGEQVEYRGALHWIVLLRSMMVAAVFSIFGIVMLVQASQLRSPQSRQTVSVLGAIAILVGVADLLAAIVRRRSAEFAVTNKRVIFKTGVVRRVIQEMFLGKIESVSVDEGLMGRALNYGTISIRGTGGTIEPFHKIAHAQEFRRQVQEQISKNP